MKHACSPDHPALAWRSVQKAVYVYGDPQDAVISLFRRSYQSHMVPKLTSPSHLAGFDYRQYVDSNLYSGDFHSFLEKGEDAFGIVHHWRAWTTEEVGFPIALVKYESLHSHLHELLDFLELPLDTVNSFPPRRNRASTCKNLPRQDADVLNSIYGAIREDMESLPAFHVREAR